MLEDGGKLVFSLNVLQNLTKLNMRKSENVFLQTEHTLVFSKYFNLVINFYRVITKILSTLQFLGMKLMYVIYSFVV